MQPLSQADRRGSVNASHTTTLGRTATQPMEVDAMHGRFEFEGAEVCALLEESRAAKERLLTEAQRYVAAGINLHAEDNAWDEDPDHPETGAPPGLWLKNDRGIYLQSNSTQRKEEQVAYARGYRADVQVGDEPFCEFVDATLLQQLRPEDTLVITASENKLRLSLIREK
jgi:hypothetical protein